MSRDNPESLFRQQFATSSMKDTPSRNKRKLPEPDSRSSRPPLPVSSFDLTCIFRNLGSFRQDRLVYPPGDRNNFVPQLEFGHPDRRTRDDEGPPRLFSSPVTAAPCPNFRPSENHRSCLIPRLRQTNRSHLPLPRRNCAAVCFRRPRRQPRRPMFRKRNRPSRPRPRSPQAGRRAAHKNFSRA